MANLGAEFPLSSTTADKFTPAVAALPDGHFAVTWLSHDSFGDGSGRVVRASLYNSDGTAAIRQSRAVELF